MSPHLRKKEEYGKMKELIDNKELVIALEELEKEKGRKKDYVIEAIETALVTEA